MKSIRTLIVDDERLARQKVRALLASDEDIDVVGECANGLEAITAVRRYKPDLLLLDIEMPGPNGFEVLQKLRSERLPMVVFVTAHDEYAVRAFEVEAVDYVMKPFDRRRFHDALRRAKRHINEQGDEWEARGRADAVCDGRRGVVAGADGHGRWSWRVGAVCRGSGGTGRRGPGELSSSPTGGDGRASGGGDGGRRTESAGTLDGDAVA